MKLMIRLSRDHWLQEVTDSIIKRFDDGAYQQVWLFSE
jgi:hypothetical protein